jgi:hypothetical protein
MDIVNGELENVTDGILKTDAATIEQSAMVNVDGVNYLRKPDAVRTVTLAGGSGVGVCYLTDDGTATGNALFTLVTNIDFQVNGTSMFPGYGWTISPDLKTLTITASQQSFTGITVVGIPVLGSRSVIAVPNGTVIMVTAKGVGNAL